MKSTRLTATAILFSLFIGCNTQQGPSKSQASSWAKGTFDGVKCEVRGDGTSSSLVGKDYNEFAAGENKLRVQDGHLTANGKDYGELKSGDSVLLNADGTLSINGQKKQSALAH